MATHAPPLRITILEGDKTGQELLEQSLRVLASDVVSLELELERFAVSLEHRRATANRVVIDAAHARCDPWIRHQGGDDHA